MCTGKRHCSSHSDYNMHQCFPLNCTMISLCYKFKLALSMRLRPCDIRSIYITALHLRKYEIFLSICNRFMKLTHSNSFGWFDNISYYFKNNGHTKNHNISHISDLLITAYDNEILLELIKFRWRNAMDGIKLLKNMKEHFDGVID